MLDLLIQENDGQFLTRAQPTIAECVTMATLQFAKQVYGVPFPTGCHALAERYAFFAERTSAALPDYPEPVIKLSHGLPALCPPTSP